MQKREIFKKIGGIITELNDQYQYLSQNPENLNDLELELFLANSSFLADHIEILRKLNHIPEPVRASAPVPLPVEPAPEPEEQPAESELPAVFSFVEVTETAFDYEQKPVAELFDRTLTAEEQAIIDRRMRTTEAPPAPEHAEPAAPAQPEPVEVIAQAEPVSVESAPAQPPARVTINDVISSQAAAPTVASRFSTHSVTDLKSIISLNNKLLFIKDLFNGYSLAYSEAIELLNRFDNLDAADHFLKHNYAVKNKWESKPETVEKLYAILGRRFS
ncbi:MAG TPA: hypothetical protein VGD92_08215 [Sphingobacteriaceae bacterium]